MNDNPSLQSVVATQFIALAEMLSSASDATWNTGSLCDSWRVREVVAHMTMPARYSEAQFMEELERYGFDFTRLSNEIASRDAGVPTSQLMGDLHSDELHHWTPPGGSYHDALNHVVIHSLDITVPLARARLASDETIRMILEDLTLGGIHRNFGIEIEGRSFEAIDIGWTFGSGHLLRGKAEDIALALCGRSVPSGQLEGPVLLRTETDQR